MRVGVALNALALIMGFAGAWLVWWLGRKEGSSLPFYADSGGKIIQSIEAENKKRQRLKDKGMGLVAISFLLQFVALFL